MDTVWRSEVDDSKLDFTNDLVVSLFFANATKDPLSPIDAASGRVADVISTLSVVDGEWYEQDDTSTLDPTVWNIPWPYASSGTSDDASFTFHWRVKVNDISSTAAFFWEWGSNEIRLQRYFNEVRLIFASGNYTIAHGVNVGDEFNITFTRDSVTNNFELTINGVKSTIANFSYTTLNNADVIRYFNEADQRREGIACFYAWVDRKLTDEQIQSLATNPYQLFQTKQEKLDEYCLSLTTASQQIVINLSGSWSGTLTESDGTETPISGSGTYTLDGSTPIKVSKIQITDSASLKLYSFNQQSGTTVKDLYGSGNDATLVNSPTFEEVIPNTDYSVGVGDYSTLTAFKTAQQDNANQSTAVINQNLTESVTFNGTGIVNIRNQTPTDFKGAGEAITGTLTLEQDVTLSGVKVDSVVTTNGNVEIFNSEIDNVTD